MARAEVYQLTFPNDKIYIGVSKDPVARLRAHSKSRYIVGKAIRRHGIPNLKILLIGEEGYCYDMEQKLVEAFDSLHPNGYNLVGGGRWGGPASELTRQRLSTAHLGHKHSSETVEKIRSAGLRENLSVETRRLRSEGNLRRKGEKYTLKTHCSKGHIMDEENTYNHPRGFRTCRICRQKYKRDIRMREKNG